MARTSDEFLAFSEHAWHNIVQQQLAKLNTHVENISERDFRRDDQDTLAEQIINQFTLTAPALDFDHIEKTSSERMVEDTSGFGAVYGQREVKRQVITYRVPFTGDAQLLRCRPSAYSLSAPHVRAQGTPNGQELCFDVVRQSNDPNQMQQDLERVRQEAEHNLDQLRTLSERLAKDVDGYNALVRAEVPSRIAARKKRMQGNDDFLSQL